MTPNNQAPAVSLLNNAIKGMFHLPRALFHNLPFIARHSLEDASAMSPWGHEGVHDPMYENDANPHATEEVH